MIELFSEKNEFMKYIPVNTPSLNGSEKEYLIKCIETGWISSEGPYVEEFEEKFAKIVGRKHAISVTNGSSALETAISVLDLKRGDEVILPTFTIISCLAPLLRIGAVPVFVDADPLTWNMNIEQVEDKITSRSKAIMAVHIYGLPVEMEPLLLLAKKYGLKVIEDAAEAHGLNYKGIACGSFGDISTFSFYPNKLITTGEGGIIVTDDDISGTFTFIRALEDYHYSKDITPAQIGHTWLNYIIEKKAIYGGVVSKIPLNSLPFLG